MLGFGALASFANGIRFSADRSCLVTGWCIGLLAGCGDACTEAGCESGVTFVVEAENTGQDQVEVCRDGSCLEVSVPTQGCNRVEEDWVVNVCADASLESIQVDAILLGSSFPRNQTYTVSLRRQQHEVVVYNDDIELTRVRPNGDDCPPTCWRALRTVAADE